MCSEVHYVGKFYGQTWEGMPLPAHISLDFLIGILSTLPAGLTVLICHPGNATDLRTEYQMERLEELKVLCDPRIRAVINELDIKPFSFGDWKELQTSFDGIHPSEN